jgi:hypothetical protein
VCIQRGARAALYAQASSILMRNLSCFVIIPSTRKKAAPVQLVRDERWGLVEQASGCDVAATDSPVVDFDDVYEKIIRAAINRVNEQNRDHQLHIECNRGEGLFEAGDIIPQLLRCVCTADITITDITTHNPNVFLEYGIRLAVKDSLNIMICHQGVALPFNIEGLRAIEYTMDIKEANEARDKIALFIQQYIGRLGHHMADESGNHYTRFVDLYTGRHLERELINVYKTSPRLISSLAQFFFTKEESPTLKQELFKFFARVGEVLEKDNPKGQRDALEYYEMVSNIKGLPPLKRQEIYYKLWGICNADPALKERGDHYLQRLKESEEQPK